MIVDLAVESGRTVDPRPIAEIALLAEAAERALNAHLDTHAGDEIQEPCPSCIDLVDIDQRMWERLEWAGESHA
jgi:hypothetical protein